MKTRTFTSVMGVAVSLLCFWRILPGQEIEWGGYLQADNRLRLNEPNDFSWQEYRLDLQTEAKPSEKARFYSEFWLRSWGIPAVQNSSELVERDKVSPWNLDIREAYADLYGFLFDNLDVRIGRQRIVWGTGDKINPTDNLNPYDLENLWDFGARLGSNGIKTSYYLKGFALTGVYIPIFTPAVLPKGNMASALSSSLELPAGLTLEKMNDTIIMPGNNVEESSTYGVKVSENMFDYDFSLSYVYGRDYLPLAKKVIFIPTATQGSIDILSELIYPRMNIGGIDMAGAVMSVGVWAEAALFLPEQIIMTMDLSRLGMGIKDLIVLDDKPYIKYVIGADYTFKNNIYINGQYVHGFLHERGNNYLEDYLMIAIEWRSFDEKLKVTPISLGAEVKDFKNIEESYAFVFSPEITYLFADAAEICLGVRWIEGKPTTTFGRLKDNDEVYLRVKFSF